MTTTSVKRTPPEQECGSCCIAILLIPPTLFYVHFHIDLLGQLPPVVWFLFFGLAVVQLFTQCECFPSSALSSITRTVAGKGICMSPTLWTIAATCKFDLMSTRNLFSYCFSLLTPLTLDPIIIWSMNWALKQPESEDANGESTRKDLETKYHMDRMPMPPKNIIEFSVLRTRSATTWCFPKFLFVPV